MRDHPVAPPALTSRSVYAKGSQTLSLTVQTILAVGMESLHLRVSNGQAQVPVTKLRSLGKHGGSLLLQKAGTALVPPAWGTPGSTFPGSTRQWEGIAQGMRRYPLLGTVLHEQQEAQSLSFQL